MWPATAVIASDQLSAHAGAWLPKTALLGLMSPCPCLASRHCPCMDMCPAIHPCRCWRHLGHKLQDRILHQLEELARAAGLQPSGAVARGSLVCRGADPRTLMKDIKDAIKARLARSEDRAAQRTIKSIEDTMISMQGFRLKQVGAGGVLCRGGGRQRIAVQVSRQSFVRAAAAACMSQRVHGCMRDPEPLGVCHSQAWKARCIGAAWHPLFTKSKGTPAPAHRWLRPAQ